MFFFFTGKRQVVNDRERLSFFIILSIFLRITVLYANLIPIIHLKKQPKSRSQILVRDLGEKRRTPSPKSNKCFWALGSTKYVYNMYRFSPTQKKQSPLKAGGKNKATSCTVAINVGGSLYLPDFQNMFFTKNISFQPIQNKYRNIKHKKKKNVWTIYYHHLLDFV